MDVSSLRKFTRTATTESSGKTSYTFDVEQPVVWDEGGVEYWELVRLIVHTDKHFQVMRFERKEGEQQWTKAFNPYAGISLKPEELELLKEVL